MKKLVRSLISFLLFMVFIHSSSYASGFALPVEHGARALGMAGAYVATASDASAIYFNPAGLAFVSGTQVYLGGTLVTGFSPTFRGVDPFPGFGVVDVQKDLLTLIPSNYFSYKPGDSKFTFGVAVNTPFGLETKWDEDTFSGRYIATRSFIATVFVAPTIAYQLHPNLSVGAGVSFNYIKGTLERRIPFPDPSYGTNIDFGQAELEGSDTSIGFNFGVLAKASENLRFGFLFRKGNKIDLDGNAQFTEVDCAPFCDLLPSNQDGRALLDYPNFIAGGVAYEKDKWLMEFDINWTSWSDVESFRLRFADESLNSDNIQNWDDTFTYRVGVEYKWKENVALRGGYIFDENPKPDESVDPILPDADRNGITLGFGYKWTENVTLDGAWLILPFKDRLITTSKDGFNGEYQTFANLFGLSLKYTFQ